jgi:hypothetical protein
MKSIAGRIFDAQIEYATAESIAVDKLLEASGIDPNGDWPLEDITFDYYDNSFEFKQTKVGWEPTPEILKKWWNLGFMRCWICYTDGTEKFYYYDQKTLA